MMRLRLIGWFSIIVIAIFLSGCSSFQGGTYSLDTPKTADHDTVINNLKRIDNQMRFQDGKVSMQNFFGQTLTCDYEVKDNVIYVKMPGGTAKEYYIIDGLTISDDKNNQDIIWKKL
jgi:hypothetical protein